MVVNMEKYFYYFLLIYHQVAVHFNMFAFAKPLNKCTFLSKQGQEFLWTCGMHPWWLQLVHLDKVGVNFTSVTATNPTEVDIGVTDAQESREPSDERSKMFCNFIFACKLVF